MDNSQSDSDTDNHNTNQNDTNCAKRSLMMGDQFTEQAYLASADSQMQELEVNEKLETSYYNSVPTIIISPPSPTAGRDSFRQDLDQSSKESRMSNVESMSCEKSSVLELDLLHTPSKDNTINISRPPTSCEDVNRSALINISSKACGGGDVTNGLDTTSSENMEVMCRYSSTPVLTSARNGQNLDDTDCSMISINNASPIAPNDSTISTPNRSSNHSLSREEENTEDKASSSNENQNLMYVSPQFLLHNPGQTMMRRDTVRPSQSSQSPFGMGRIINHSYQPTSSVPAGTFPNSQNVYSNYMQGSGAAYPDYFPTRESSWTDLSYRSDTSPVPPVTGSAADSCCFPTAGGESEYFVYPSIYVSSSGLISVLLRNDMSVEMTVDRTIRVVSHNHMMAVATDSRGTAACLYHPAVKVFQIGTTTDIATLNFRARMGGGDTIVFSNGVNFFKLEDSELQPTAPIKFTDILRDQSVNLLFSSEGYGESLVASCMQVAAQAEYANLPKGGVIVRINGVKVTQTGGGDVTVVTGAKFIRLSPHFGTTRLGNRFVDIEVEKDWTVKLTRGSHSFVYSKKRAMVCNGKMEAGFDENNGLKVTNLQLRLPLLAEPSVVRRPCRKPTRIPSTSGTPKRRPGPPAGTGRGAGMT